MAPAIHSIYLTDCRLTTDDSRFGLIHRWLRTGDEVIINKRKEIFVVDRIKELIKVRGFQVAPSELEGHLLEHAAVADVCVVSIPDDFSGELPLAFVVLAPGVQAAVMNNPQEERKIKQELMKVPYPCPS